MKKLLLLSASLLLVGAGCTAQPASPAPETPAADTTGAPAPRPTGATPIKGGSESVNGAGGIEFDAGTGADAGVSASANATFTAGGSFSPAVLTVSQGETVTWTNVGDKPLWIASDPHPTHNDYPGFDSKAPIERGGSYSFTFDKKGSWGYHNHFNPAVKGTVIVE